jgi:hypothetical protein
MDADGAEAGAEARLHEATLARAERFARATQGGRHRVGPGTAARTTAATGARVSAGLGEGARRNAVGVALGRFVAVTCQGRSPPRRGDGQERYQRGLHATQSLSPPEFMPGT